MSFEYSQSIKHARLQAVADHVGPGATLEFGDGDGMNVVLGVIRLASPPFNRPVDGRLELAGVPLIGVALAEGTVTTARIVDASGEVQIYDFIVGPVDSGAQIELISTKLHPGMEINLKEGVIVHA
jgi:hypothetical protein